MERRGNFRLRVQMMGLGRANLNEHKACGRLCGRIQSAATAATADHVVSSLALGLRVRVKRGGRTLESHSLGDRESYLGRTGPVILPIASYNSISTRPSPASPRSR